MALTIEEQFKALKMYQKCGIFHPLTCCKHVTMIPEIQKDQVVLVCPDCGRIQEQYPHVLELLFATMKTMKTSNLQRYIVEINIEPEEREAFYEMVEKVNNNDKEDET